MFDLQAKNVFIPKFQLMKNDWFGAEFTIELKESCIYANLFRRARLISVLRLQEWRLMVLLRGWRNLDISLLGNSIKMFSSLGKCIISSFLFFSNYLYILSDIFLAQMVIVAGYGHGDTSSNPGPD